MLRQIPLPYSFDEIWDVYSKLRDKEKLIVDVNNQDVKIE